MALLLPWQCIRPLSWRPGLLGILSSEIMLLQTHAPGLTAMLTSGTEEGQQCGALAIANIAANDSQNIFEIGQSVR
jgi:hypothetical protein